jgi:hypothetical protein
MAGPIISHNELFDFEGYRKSIKDVETATKEFGTSVDQTIKNIAANQREWLNTMREVSAVLKSFNINTIGAKDALLKYNEEIETARQENERLRATGEGLKTMLDTTKASVAELRAEYGRQKKELENLKPSQADYSERTAEINARMKAVLPGIKSFETELRNTKKYVDVVNDSYAQMQQRLTALKNEFKNMANAIDPVTGKLNKNNLEAIRLANEISTLDKTLKTADATMGVFGRHVGDYGRAFSPMQNAVNQITREAPSAAVSMQTFFLAISNNLPALTDAITNLKAANVELVASGEKPKSVFRELMGSVFSFQTLISVGITLLTLYGGKIVDWVKNLFSGKDALDKTRESQELLNKAMAGTEYSSAIKSLDELKINVGLAKQGFIDKRDVVEQYNETIGNTMGQVKTLDEVEQKLVKNGPAYIQMMLLKAAAQLALQEAAKKAMEVAQQQAKDAEDFLKFGDKLVDISERSATAAPGGFIVPTGDPNKRADQDRKARADKRKAARVKEVHDEQDFYEKLAGDFQKRAAQISKANNFDFFSDAGKDDKNRNKGAEDALKKLRDYITKQQEILKSAAELQIKENELRLARGLMSEFDFQSKKLNIIRGYTQKAADLENTLGKNKDPKRLTDFQKERQAAELEFTKFMNDQQKERSRLALQSIDDVAKAEAAAKKKQSDQEDEFNKKFADGAKMRLDLTLNRLRREFELEEAHRGKNFSSEIKYLQAIIQAKKRAGEDYAKDEESLNIRMAQREHEIQMGLQQLLQDAVSAGLSIIKDQVDAHFQERIAKLEEEKTYELNLAGTNAAARAAIERDYQRRIAKEKEKQAKADKAFAIFNVALNTAAAIAKTIAEWGMPFALPFVAIAAAQGAIQAAVIAARPIPHYEKGTRSAKKGPAVINEKGWEIIERNGRMFVEKGIGPTLVNLKGGEKVYTHQQSLRIIEKAVRDDSRDSISAIASASRMAAAVHDGKKNQSVQMMAEAMQKSGMNEGAMQRVMDRTLAKMPVHSDIYDERGYRRRIQQMNEAVTYLNKRFSN